MSVLTGLDLERAPRFGPVRRAVVLVGLVLAGLAWVQVGDTGDIEVADIAVGPVPVRLYLPQPPAERADGVDRADAEPSTTTPRAGVVVVHGFAGSRQLMHTGALALARAGNVVAVPDLAGHGASPVRLPLGTGRNARDVWITDEVIAVTRALADRPEVDAERVGALGHSMGSGAVLRAGIQDPALLAAVVAVSPTDAPVDEAAPRNLLLLAGELEASFAANAQRLLVQAGGASDDLDAALARGDARAVELVLGVEHVTILFSPVAHEAAAQWFSRGLRPGGEDSAAASAGRPITAPADRPITAPADRPITAPAGDGLLGGIAPITWWALHLFAVVAVWRASVPVLAEPTVHEGRTGRPVVGLIVGAVAATVLLGVLDVVVDLGTLAGMLVGPAVVVWLALAGVGWAWLGGRPGPPGGRDLVWGLAILAVLVAAFGAMAPQAWLAFFPIRARAVLILPFALALLPFSVAFATAIHERRPVVALGWWLVVSSVVVVGLNAAANVVDDLGFVRLITPAFPALLGLIQLIATPVRRPWATAIAAAGLLGWTIATLFPLV